MTRLLLTVLLLADPVKTVTVILP